MSGLVDHLLQVPPGLAYFVITALVFAEAAVFVGFVLPGETAVVIGGVLAANGRIQLAVLLPLVVVAAVVGDSVGYEVGRHYGPRLLRTRPLRGTRNASTGRSASCGSVAGGRCSSPDSPLSCAR